MSVVCSEDNAHLYMSLIGVLCWVVKLGRFDICYEVLIMLPFSSMSRYEQLEQLHLFVFK